MKRKTIETPDIRLIKEAVRKDDKEADRRRIRQLLAKPMKDRMNFLRVKVGRGSSL